MSPEYLNQDSLDPDAWRKRGIDAGLGDIVQAATYAWNAFRKGNAKKTKKELDLIERRLTAIRNLWE